MVRLLSIDAGTTAMKAAIFDLEGHLLAIDRQEYTLLTPSPSVVELDAETYWSACCRAVRHVIGLCALSPEDIKAVCISSQGETIIPMGEDGRPTHNAIIWLDNRAVEEAAIITSQFGIQEIQQISGQPEISPIWPACKILWLKRHKPEVFARTRKFMLVEDYLIYRLTGNMVSNCSVQTSSLFFNINTRQWWDPMFEFIGLSTGHFGRLVEPGEVIAPIQAVSAEVLGLSIHTLVVSGGLDQTIGAIGAGNISPSMVSETTGSAMAVLVTLDKPLLDPLRRIPCFYHSMRGAYTLMPWGQTAGMALRWFRDQFYSLETRMAQEQGQDAYTWMSREAGTVPPGSDGLLVLPHLEGAACPELNPHARGVFFGMTLRHTRAHFMRAILESVAYMLKKNLDLVEQLGIEVKEVRSIGGGARSDVWLQIKADLLQKPIAVVAVEEAACLGAALTAAVATGYYSSLEGGVSQMVRIRQMVSPKPENHEAYRQGYARYNELYERLEPMFNPPFAS